MISSFSVGALLKNKQDKIFSVSAGVRNNSVFNSEMTPYVEGGLYWKVNLRKK